MWRRVAGIDVVLNDLSDDRLKAGLATINGTMTRQVKKGQMSEAARSEALTRITTAQDFAALGDCDLVIEAATENEVVKRKIFSTLCASLKPATLLASNTSSISITRLASVTDRPERFIGIHFMNPVPRMQLVELIRGIQTAPDTFETAKAFIDRLGKTPTVSEDFPAFIVNRILLPMINEAVYTLHEGIGSVEAIDTAMRLGANHPMGAAATRRFHRARHVPCRDAGVARGIGRFEVSALSAARQIRRGGLARAKNSTRLL